MKQYTMKQSACLSSRVHCPCLCPYDLSA